MMEHGPIASFPDALPPAELFGDAHYFAVEYGRQQLPQAYPGGGIKHSVVEIADDPVIVGPCSE